MFTEATPQQLQQQYFPILFLDLELIELAMPPSHLVSSTILWLQHLSWSEINKLE